MWPLFVLFFLSTSGLGYLIVTIAPQKPADIGIFFVLLFLFLYSLFTFLLRSSAQGMLIACCVVVFFLLQFFHLRSPLFTILLLILFFSAEGVVWKR